MLTPLTAPICRTWDQPYDFTSCLSAAITSASAASITAVGITYTFCAQRRSAAGSSWSELIWMYCKFHIRQCLNKDMHKVVHILRVHIHLTQPQMEGAKQWSFQPIRRNWCSRTLIALREERTWVWRTQRWEGGWLRVLHWACTSRWWWPYRSWWGMNWRGACPMSRTWSM